LIEYHSIAELVTLAEEKKCRISDAVLEDQAEAMEKTAEELSAMMKNNLDVMKNAAEKGKEEGIRSRSGLSGGDGFRMASHAEGRPLSGPFCAKALARAIAIAEFNAAMGKIVAAPTAGSCGILPAAVLTMMEEKNSSEEDALMALFTAGAMGMVIANEASLAGAEGGCMAECGSAAAIAAAALVEMSGGSPSMAAEAFAMALKNQLGLVCDPVAGLVEVPCIKRNAGGIMCALGAADMALAGIKSVIPADEVILAMKEIGDSLSQALRETAQGGLAVTPTGLALKQKIFG
jgi:L-serine dehydratase